MSRLRPPAGPGDHLLGPHDAPVTVVEYGDYQCPFCRRAESVVTELLRMAQGRILYVWRQFPLVEIHPNSVLAAEASEAAGAQGRFWPMHHMLFENQNALEPDDLLSYAELLELDTARFARELQEHAHLERVQRDFHSGIRSGVNGTPTFFLNGIRHDGSWDLPSLSAAVGLAARGDTAH